MLIPVEELFAAQLRAVKTEPNRATIILDQWTVKTAKGAGAEKGEIVLSWNFTVKFNLGFLVSCSRSRINVR